MRRVPLDYFIDSAGGTAYNQRSMSKRLSDPTESAAAAGQFASHRAERLRALHEAALALAATQGADPDSAAALMRTILQHAGATVGGQRNSWLTLAEDPAWARLVPGTGPQDGYITVRETGDVFRATRHAQGATAHALATGEPVYVPDTRVAFRFGLYPTLSEQGIRSFVIVPLRTGGRVLGAMALQFVAPHALHWKDQETLELLAAHAAAAIERARQAHAEQQRAAKAEQLASTLAEVGGAVDLRDALEALARGAMLLLGGHRSLARLFDPSDARCLLEVLVQRGGEHTITESSDLPPGSFGAILQAGGSAALVDDYLVRGQRSYPPPERLAQLDTRSAIHVPIEVSGSRIGSLHLSHPHPGFFTAADLSLASALATQAGAAIARARLEAERVATLAAQARLDGALLVARTVAHEINNALGPVVGFADLLRLHATVAGDSTAIDYAGNIAQAGEEMARRVQRLQRIIRLEEESALGLSEAVLNLDRSTALPLSTASPSGDPA